MFCLDVLKFLFRKTINLWTSFIFGLIYLRHNFHHRDLKLCLPSNPPSSLFNMITEFALFRPLPNPEYIPRFPNSIISIYSQRFVLKININARKLTWTPNGYGQRTEISDAITTHIYVYVHRCVPTLIWLHLELASKIHEKQGWVGAFLPASNDNGNIL